MGVPWKEAGTAGGLLGVKLILTEFTAFIQLAKVGGAALDVFENEPRVPQALIDLPQVVLAPHIGSATVETRQAMAGLALDNLRADHWVADIVYFPLETALLAEARTRGCHVAHGGDMAVFQAVGAFRLFTGREPDVDRMLAHFLALTNPDPMRGERHG